MVLEKSDLNQFTGTSNYYRHWTRRFVYTDGVQYLVDKGEAHWLLDAIASHQTRQLLSDPMLKEIQFWTLFVHPDGSAVLRCLRDTDDVALTQEIEYTDFPLNSIKLYLTQGVLMLPSEY